MKKLSFTLSFLTALFCLNTANAQSCGNDGSSACTPTGVAGGGFQDGNTVSCAERSVYYNSTIQFTMFSQFNFQGQQSVDSIQINSITNLPCGLCYNLNQADKRYTANENGCIQIVGTTNDPAGQYKLGLNMTAWINGLSTGIPVSASLANQAGIAVYFRVKEVSGNCANLDTTGSANNLTATTGCPVGIAEISNAVSEVNVFPNPMNSNAKLTFVSEMESTYYVTVTDFRGAEVMKLEKAANVGINEMIINRSGLSAGVYFVSVSDGKLAITKRFTVID